MTNSVASSKRPKLVGNFIRQRRETLNLSQRALGLLFDPPVTTQFISNVERGVTPLPPAHVPTLTKALQVSESEMMGLLEKEYTMKLSGRLGISHDAAAVLGTPVAIISGGANESAHIEVLPHDYKFIRELYDALKGADSQTRKNFANLCESVLNVTSS